MRSFLESFFFVSCLLLVFTLGSIEYIPTEEQVNTIYAILICASLSFLMLMVNAYCRKVGGITFARFGKVFVSFGVSK